MAVVFKILLGILDAIPTVRMFYEAFAAYYIRTKITAMQKENRDAIRKAVLEQDQIDLEKALGNPNAGEPSGIDGVIVRPDAPWGVHNKTTN